MAKHFHFLTFFGRSMQFPLYLTNGSKREASEKIFHERLLQKTVLTGTFCKFDHLQNTICDDIFDPFDICHGTFCLSTYVHFRIKSKIFHKQEQVSSWAYSNQSRCLFQLASWFPGISSSMNVAVQVSSATCCNMLAVVWNSSLACLQISRDIFQYGHTGFSRNLSQEACCFQNLAAWASLSGNLLQLTRDFRVSSPLWRDACPTSSLDYRMHAKIVSWTTGCMPRKFSGQRDDVGLAPWTHARVIGDGRGNILITDRQ